MTGDAFSARPTTADVGGALALLAAAAQVGSAFLSWTAGQVVTAVDLSLVAGDRPALPTIGLVLIMLAALPAVAVLVGRHAWPRAASAGGTAALVLWWLARGDDAGLVAGVWTAIAAAVAHLLAAALAD